MSKLGYTYIGVSYVDDPYGAFWKDAFVAACSAMKCKDASGKPTAESCPIQVITSGLIGGNKESVEQSVEIMKSANVKVGFIVTYDDDMNFFMDKAVAEGMVGGDYFWVFADGIVASAVVAAANIDPLRAHGHARLTAMGGLVGNPNYDKFLNDWLNNFDNDVGLKAFAEELFWDYTADAGSQMNYDAGAAGGWHPEGTDLSVVEDSFFQDNFPDDVATYGALLAASAAPLLSPFAPALAGTRTTPSWRWGSGRATTSKPGGRSAPPSTGQPTSRRSRSSGSKASPATPTSSTLGAGIQRAPT
jgi:hypothetical protein